MEIKAMILAENIVSQIQFSGQYPISILGNVKAVTGGHEVMLNKSIWFCAANQQVRQQVEKLGVHAGGFYHIQGRIIERQNREKYIVFQYIEKNENNLKGFISLWDSEIPL